MKSRASSARMCSVEVTLRGVLRERMAISPAARLRISWFRIAWPSRHLLLPSTITLKELDGSFILNITSFSSPCPHSAQRTASCLVGRRVPEGAVRIGQEHLHRHDRAEAIRELLKGLDSIKKKKKKKKSSGLLARRDAETEDPTSSTKARQAPGISSSLPLPHTRGCLRWCRLFRPDLRPLCRSMVAAFATSYLRSVRRVSTATTA